eukprot:7136502-Alexandrium_andersonii.AAC.1
MQGWAALERPVRRLARRPRAVHRFLRQDTGAFLRVFPGTYFRGARLRSDARAAELACAVGAWPSVGQALRIFSP